MDDIYKLIGKAQKGDRQAAQEIVEKNSGLIWSVVRKFANRGVENDDLFQLGAIGILKCIYKFDMTYDVKFSTYAVPMIMGEIRRFLRDDGLIKISRPIKELAIKAKYSEEVFVKKNHRPPTLTELANILEVDIENLIIAMESIREVESINGSAFKNDNTNITLEEKITDSDNSEETLINKLVLNQIIASLEHKEREVIKLRYFKDKTQSEVASIIGVSQVQVSRIEKKVLKKIRQDFIGSI